MKIVAIKDMSAGNETVGDMWKETGIFTKEDTLEKVIKQMGATTNKNILLSIVDDNN